MKRTPIVNVDDTVRAILQACSNEDVVNLELSAEAPETWRNVLPADRQSERVDALEGG